MKKRKVNPAKLTEELNAKVGELFLLFKNEIIKRKAPFFRRAMSLLERIKWLECNLSPADQVTFKDAVIFVLNELRDEKMKHERLFDACIKAYKLEHSARLEKAGIVSYSNWKKEFLFALTELVATKTEEVEELYNWKLMQTHTKSLSKQIWQPVVQQAAAQAKALEEVQEINDILSGSPDSFGFDEEEERYVIIESPLVLEHPVILN